jgi:tRNA(Ile2) C34 agmatinyltransferase TiaS
MKSPYLNPPSFTFSDLRKMKAEGLVSQQEIARLAKAVAVDESERFQLDDAPVLPVKKPFERVERKTITVCPLCGLDISSTPDHCPRCGITLPPDKSPAKPRDD